MDIISEKFLKKFYKYNRVPDAVVVEGSLSGGHQGFKKKDVIDPKISLSSIIKDTIHEINHFEQKYGIEIPVKNYKLKTINFISSLNVFIFAIWRYY